MPLYDVWRAENRVNGDTDYVESIEADNEADALAEAVATCECRCTQHLYVSLHCEDDDAEELAANVPGRVRDTIPPRGEEDDAIRPSDDEVDDDPAGELV